MLERALFGSEEQHTGLGIDQSREILGKLASEFEVLARSRTNDWTGSAIGSSEGRGKQSQQGDQGEQTAHGESPVSKGWRATRWRIGRG
jgi:hypothetical protein